MLDRELVEAVRLAREAGRILLEIYATDFSVEQKSDDPKVNDPVTEADRRVNAFLAARLHEAFPTDSIVAEESGGSVWEVPRASGRTWFVDPLDGTKEFIAKNGEFSVMIGLAIEGDAALGVVYQPTSDKLYRGVVGDGAFLEHADKTWVLKPTDTSDPKSLRLVVSRSHRSASTDELVAALGISEERASGSVGLKVGLIGEREADLYVHLSDKSSLWDACAPEAVLRAAGGMFTDLGGRSISYSATDETKNKRGILACNRKSFEKIAPIVAEIAKRHGLIE